MKHRAGSWFAMLPILVLLVTVLALAGSRPLSVTAQPAVETPALELEAVNGGVRLNWDLAAGSLDQLQTTPLLEPVTIDGYELPARLLALQVASGTILDPQVTRLTSSAWAGQLQRAELPVPQTSDGEPRPALAPAVTPELPAEPVIVLREGRSRGATIVVVAFSPIFGTADQPQVATGMTVFFPGATLYDPARPAAAQPGPLLADVPPPPDPAAAGPAWKLTVSQSGIQQVSGADLAAAGLDLATLDPQQLQLQLRGAPVALEIRDGADGRLDPQDLVRFYAPPPGDRWNQVDHYWLTVAALTPLRIASRDVTPATAPARDTAFEYGTWRNNQRYDPALPGPDGDHWFAADWRVAGGSAGVPVSLTLTLTPTLPLAPGTTAITVSGSTYLPGPHTLEVRVGTAAERTVWTGVGNFARRVNVSANDPAVRLTLLPSSEASAMKPDSIDWQRPVTLDFGGRGATFAGGDTIAQYQLRNLPTGADLYDVSDPQRPELLTGLTSAFEDGPQRRYLLAGPGTVHTPAVTPHQAVDLSAAFEAQVLYIAPAAFHAALQPLADLRRAQGYSVAVVDVQALYDAWSFGHVAPPAIRNFLRYATATGSVAPLAVILVGDGSSDPFDYTARGAANVNHIPPYLAMVDPFQGETACDMCYAQLDGSDPVDPATGADALADLWFGRLPVKTATELDQLVAKLIAYETDTDAGSWRSRVVYLADDPDPSGDFVGFVERSASLQPAGVAVGGIAYNPDGERRSAVVASVPDARQAHQAVLNELNQGAGVVAYVGHSHTWQWAVTDLTSEPSWLLSLFDPDGLRNANRLPVVLTLTCLSSAFQQPAISGTTVDERLLLKPDGGAAAVWGSTGLGVSFGHDSLQRGFFTRLWSLPPQQARLGDLAQAGYLELFSNGTCCQEALRMQVLLGDPLTPARVDVSQRVYLPLVTR